MKSDSRIRLTLLTVGLEWGGAERLILDIAPKLDPSRFRVSVVSLKTMGSIGTLLQGKGIRVVALEASRTSPFSAIAKWRAFLREEEPHIVHSHLRYANLLACLLHNSHQAVITHHHYTVVLGNALSRSVERYALRRAQQVVAVSEAVKDTLEQFSSKLSSRIQVVYNGVDLNRFKPRYERDQKVRFREQWGIPPHAPMIGYVGRLDEPIKGLSILLQSFQILQHRVPESHLVIVGEGPSRKSLEKQAESLGVASKIRWIGPHPQTETIYPFFNVFALPSLSEGLPMTLLEAMACARPVVATRVGGIPEALHSPEVGHCVPANDPKAFAAGLFTYLQEPAAALQIGETARLRVDQHFNLQNTLKQLNILYERVFQHLVE